MKPEDIAYNQSEETQFDINENELSEKKEIEKVNSVEEVKDSKSKNFLKGEWQTIAIGSGTGLVFGAAGSLLANELNAEDIDQITPGPHPEPNSHNPLIVDDDIAVATCIDDRMTFSQAFAAARAEVGSGGVFEWHGNLYGTYYAEEWNAMTSEQKEEYNNHFAWGRNHANHNLSDTIGSHHENHSNNHVSDQTAYTHNGDHAHNQNVNTSNDTYLDENVSTQVINNQSASHVEHNTSNETIACVEENDDDSEVEVLGVVQDGQDELDGGTTIVGGQEGYIIELIGDLLFSSIAAEDDTNKVQGDGVLDSSSSQVMGDNLEGSIDNGTEHLVDSTNEIDYTD